MRHTKLRINDSEYEHVKLNTVVFSREDYLANYSEETDDSLRKKIRKKKLDILDVIECSVGFEAHDIVFIQSIKVDYDYRGKGLGSEVINDIKSKLEKYDVIILKAGVLTSDLYDESERLSIEVEEDMEKLQKDIVARNVRFYKSNGFKVVDEFKSSTIVWMYYVKPDVRLFKKSNSF